MSRIKAIIYTSSDNKNNLVFENEDILAISTNTKCIENENLPEFDIFPNSGTLTVKDRNLDIYNKAINGVFDNYEYKVEYYLENEIIATHIINQRPKYDYDAKTCTFYLGNSLDNLANQTFTPYDYPLKSETLYEIFYKVLVKIFNISQENYDDLMRNIWGNSSVTFAKYFQQINITYPYLSQTNSREALKTILFIAQCGLYLDKNNKLKLIRLDGYSNASADEYYNNVYKIEPRHMNKGFVPSVILDNKFNQINLDCVAPKTVVNVDDTAYVFSETPIFKDDKWSNGIQTPSIEQEYETTFVVDKKHLINPYNYKNEYFIAQAKLTDIINFNSNDIENFSPIKKLQNNNLKEILQLNVLGSNTSSNEAPSVVVQCKKSVYTYSCGIKNIENYTKGIEADNLSLKSIETTYESIDIFKNNEFQFDISFTSLGANFNPNFKFNLKVFNPYNEYGFNTTLDGSNFKTSAVFLCGKTIELIFGHCKDSSYEVTFPNYFPKDPSGIIEATECYKQVIYYNPVKIDITYNGTVKEIVFDESSYSKKFEETQTISYENTLQSSLELNQKASFINQTNTQEAITTNLLSSFNQGLHTGTLTVANTNYDLVNPKYETVTQPITFTGQEKNYFGMPVSTASFTQFRDGLYETINGKELSTSSQQIERGLKDVEINDVSTQILYKITAKKDTSKKQTIITIEFDLDTLDTNINKLKFYDFKLPATIKKLINSNKKLFEIGDKVMPYKDKPIINRVTSGVEEPVVFQIVDCETFNESGATFQNLVLREIKKPLTT